MKKRQVEWKITKLTILIKSMNRKSNYTKHKSPKPLMRKNPFPNLSAHWACNPIFKFESTLIHHTNQYTVFSIFLTFQLCLPIQKFSHYFGCHHNHILMVKLIIFDVLKFLGFTFIEENNNKTRIIEDHSSPLNLNINYLFLMKKWDFWRTLFPLRLFHSRFSTYYFFTNHFIYYFNILLTQVPGVEADDAIGTLALRSVRVVSPDKDFFQILSPSLRLLKIAPHGIEFHFCGFYFHKMASFGMEDFAKRYGTLKPSQFVDVLALVGDRPTTFQVIVEGIGDVNVVQLLARFGTTLENILQHVDEIKEDCIRKALIANVDQAILSKNLVLLRSDLPVYMVPFVTEDLIFTKPEDNGEKYNGLLTTVATYAKGFSADPVIRRTFHLWKKVERR
ncbi:hypothetical protein UlMin_008487 [Ulmus minor]